MPIASIEGGDLCKVWEIKTLGLARDGNPRKPLEDVAKQVQPIMRKRKWKVLLLSELCLVLPHPMAMKEPMVVDSDAQQVLEHTLRAMNEQMNRRTIEENSTSKELKKENVPRHGCQAADRSPQNQSLLGLNIDGGREIRIRLRRHPSDPQWFDYEETLGTMLHELTHIQCGPHDAAFYKLLDELKKECEELMIKGIKGTGQGFDTRGHRLGGFKHNPPPTTLRDVALAAAEKRAKMGATMPSGPRRLGGDSDVMNALSPLQAAAMAAERRMRDDLCCAAPVIPGKDILEKTREREPSNGSKGKALLKSNNSATKENLGLRENSQGGALEATGSGRIRRDGLKSSNRRADGSSGRLVLGEQPVTGRGRVG